MNYLAHIFLSGNDTELMIGNFIADHIKPQERTKFSPQINAGIKLHYAIDTFTDNHNVVLKSKERLRPHLHKYAPVVVDVIYDHFLAKYWHLYHHQDLLEYTIKFYNMLHAHRELLPDKTKYILNYMEPRNWLYNYQHLHELEKIFGGMGRRANFDNNMALTVKHLENDYNLFDEEFKFFFAQLYNFCHGYKK